ncbi:MAG: MOSC domain-containing protein [Salinarimonas sp.]
MNAPATPLDGVPRLSAIYRYPLESARGERLEVCGILGAGIAGDRAWAVIDETRRCLTVRERPDLLTLSARLAAGNLRITRPDGETLVVREAADGTALQVRLHGREVTARLAGEEARDFLSRTLGPGLRLVRVDAQTRAGLCDTAPLRLVLEESFRALAAHCPVPLSLERFRPNLVVSGAPAWADEAWADAGVELVVGTAPMRVVDACERCAVPSDDPDTGAQEDAREPLRTLHALRGGALRFGLLVAPVLEPAVLRVGDTVVPRLMTEA